jgi:photosystem II stability/assembly factor-like uncharacterized protein
VYISRVTDAVTGKGGLLRRWHFQQHAAARTCVIKARPWLFWCAESLRTDFLEGGKMRPSSFFICHLLSLAVVSSLSVSANPQREVPTRASDRSSAEEGWHWQNPLPQGNRLHRICFASANCATTVGEHGTIMQTTDAGETWVVRSSGTSKALYDVMFTTESIGTAVGANHTILRTSDGGKFWVPQLEGGSEALIGVTFANPDTGIAVGWGSVLRTTNGGQTWSTVLTSTTVSFSSVTFGGRSRAIVVGSRGTILCSTDAGSTWVNQESGTTTALRGVCFTSADTGTAVGYSGLILNTVDGGTTWWSQSVGEQVGFSEVCYGNKMNGYAIGSVGDAPIETRFVVYRTDNGGGSWVPKYPGVDDNMGGVAFSNGEVGLITCVNKILRTTNRGNSWSRLTSGETGRLNSVSFTSGMVGTAVGNDGIILRTSDGGATWEAQPEWTSANLRGVSFTDADTGTTVGFSGIILHTTNGGTTWKLQWDATTENLYDVSCINGNVATAVGENGTILRTTNGGSTWIQQVSGTTNRLYGVSFLDINTGTAVGAAGTVLHTTNGGGTWTPQSSGTTAWLNAVELYDSTNGTIAGGLGVILRTTNGGTTWTKQTSVANSDLYDVTFVSPYEGTIVGDFWILHTIDGGQTWLEQPSPTNNGLLGICFTDADTGTVVGGGGTILRMVRQFPAILTVTPEAASVTAAEGATTCQVTNTGGRTMYWTAASDQSWATVSPGSGMNSGSLAVHYSTNVSLIDSRTATIAVGADGATGSPTQITLHQSAASFKDLSDIFPLSKGQSHLYDYKKVSWWQAKTSSDYRRESDSGTVAYQVLYSEKSGDSLTVWVVRESKQFVHRVDSWTAQGGAVHEVTPVADSVATIALLEDGHGFHRLRCGGLVWQLPDSVVAPADTIYRYWPARWRRYRPSLADSGDYEIGFAADSGLTRLSWSRWSSGDSSFTGDTISARLINFLPTDVKPEGMASEWQLQQNYPNPFNPTTTIRFTIAGVVALSGSEGPATKVRLAVYDLLGREVAVLVDEKKELGSYEVQFDGSRLSSGVYFYRMLAGDFVQTRKLLLLR